MLKWATKRRHGTKERSHFLNALAIHLEIHFLPSLSLALSSSGLALTTFVGEEMSLAPEAATSEPDDEIRFSFSPAVSGAILLAGFRGENKGVCGAEKLKGRLMINR